VVILGGVGTKLLMPAAVERKVLNKQVHPENICQDYTSGEELSFDKQLLYGYLHMLQGSDGVSGTRMSRNMGEENVQGAMKHSRFDN
jgi:nicotinic acid phosphoribosyltransferase